MKNQNKIRMLSLLLVGFLAFLPGSVLATTTSGVAIQNDATVGYWVGGVDQGFLNASSIFTVDKKVDYSINYNSATVTVTPGSTAGAVATPGSTVNVLSFQIINSGNTAQSFALAAVKNGGAMTMANLRVYLDDGTDVGAWDLGDTAYSDAATGTSTAQDGGTLDVLIVADAPGTDPADAAIDNVWLKATVTQDGTNTVEVDDEIGDDGVNQEDAVDVVLLDIDTNAIVDTAARNGIVASEGTYQFAAVTLTISKTTAIVDDNNATTIANYFLPGATVEYTIVVTHTAGSGSATLVSIGDTIPTNTTALSDVYGVSGDVNRVRTGTFADSADLDTLDPELTGWGGASFAVACGSMVLNDTCTITFQATID